MTQRASRRFRIVVRSAAALAFVSLTPLAHSAPCAGFTDVDSASAFCANVAWMKNRGITLGCAANLYCPNDAVSRLAMAAFMNRLGDAVLPPSVTWVSATGGTFHTIQAAIDAAAATATSSNRALVKIAPGIYNEQVTMKPYVDVEGSGEDNTTISSNVCGSGAPPTVATVVLSDNAQLRRITVNNTGTGPANCAALVATNAGPSPLDHVTATASAAIGVGNASVALFAAYLTPAQPRFANLTLSALASASGQAIAFYGVTSNATITLENSTLSAAAFNPTPQYATGAWMSGSFILRDVSSTVRDGSIQTTAYWLDSGSLIARRAKAAVTVPAGAMSFGFFTPTSAAGAAVTVSDSEVVVSGAGSWDVAVYAGNGTTEIMNASLRATGGTVMDFAIVTAAAANTRVAHSKLVAGGAPTSTSGSITCFGNYSSTYVAVTC